MRFFNTVTWTFCFKTTSYELQPPWFPSPNIRAMLRSNRSRLGPYIYIYIRNKVSPECQGQTILSYFLFPWLMTEQMFIDICCLSLVCPCPVCENQLPLSIGIRKSVWKKGSAPKPPCSFVWPPPNLLELALCLCHA